MAGPYTPHSDSGTHSSNQRLTIPVGLAFPSPQHMVTHVNGCRTLGKDRGRQLTILAVGLGTFLLEAQSLLQSVVLA